MGEAARKLIRKDLRVFRPGYQALVLVAFLLAALQTFLQEEVFFWIAVALACVLATLVPALEWLQGSGRMLSSLPVRRDAIVRARYAWGIMACGVAILLWSATGVLLAAILAPDQGHRGMWVTLEGWLTFLSVAGLFIACLLPLYFLLGFGWGTVTFSVLAVVLVVGAATLGPVLHSGLSAPSVSASGAWIQSPTSPLRSAISHLVGEVGVVGAASLILLSLGGTLALSAWLSVRAFRGREL